MTGSESAPSFAGLDLKNALAEFDTPAPAPAPRPDKVAIAAVSERAGFPSREPAPLAPVPAHAAVRPLNYDERLNLRVAMGDKKRFDDFAYKLRVPKGEAFKRMLDAFEAQQKD